MAATVPALPTPSPPPLLRPLFPLFFFNNTALRFPPRKSHGRASNSSCQSATQLQADQSAAETSTSEHAVQKAPPVRPALPSPLLRARLSADALISILQGGMDKALAAKIASFEGSAASDKEEQKILSTAPPRPIQPPRAKILVFQTPVFPGCFKVSSEVLLELEGGNSCVQVAGSTRAEPAISKTRHKPSDLENTRAGRLLKKATKDLKDHLDPVSDADKVKYLEKKYLDTSAPTHTPALPTHFVNDLHVDNP